MSLSDAWKERLYVGGIGATAAWPADLVRVEVRRRMPDDVGFAYVVAYLRRGP